MMHGIFLSFDKVDLRRFQQVCIRCVALQLNQNVSRMILILMLIKQMKVQILLLAELVLLQCCNVFHNILTPGSLPRTLELPLDHSQEIGIGIWTKFHPFITKFDQDLKEMERMFVFFQSNPKKSEYYIIYSIKYDGKANTLYHELYLYLGDAFQIFSLPIDATSANQRWVFLYLCRSQGATGYSIFSYYAAEREYTQMATGINGIWKPNQQYVYVIGSTLLCSNQFMPSLLYNLSVFRGQISDIYLKNVAGAFFENISAFTNFIEGLVCDTPEPCPNKQTRELLNAVTKFDGYGFISTSFAAKQSRYLISGWSKLKALDLENQYNSVMMRATINSNYKDNQRQGDRAFYLQYRQNIQADLNGFYFSTYSTNPDESTDLYSSTPADEWVESDPFYELALSQWHYFTFQYGLSDPTLNTKLEIYFSYQQVTKTKFFNSRKQLADQTYYFYIGGDKYSQANLFRGYTANLVFEFCFKTDQTPQKPCHYSCAACLGPTEQDCNLCTNPLLSNRELIASTKECRCKPNYIDREGQMNCENSGVVFDFVQIDELEETSSCKYGDFAVNGEFCMPCPSQFQEEGIQCADCWMRPRSWYLEPKCTFDFLKDEGVNTNFLKRARLPKDETYYQIDKINKKLIHCDGCMIDYAKNSLTCKPCYKLDQNGNCYKYLQNCRQCNDLTETCTLCEDRYAWTPKGCASCPSHCIQCSYAVNRVECSKCESKYGLDRGSCTQCGQYCDLCERQELTSVSLMKCYRCEDTSKYMMSMDAVNCRLNILPNCLIAAQYKVTNGWLRETSVDVKFTPTNEAEYTTFCFRCKAGFLNDSNQNKCVPSTNFDEEIAVEGGTVGLGKNSNPSESQKCSANCQKCIHRYIFDQIFCLECNYGYYSNKIFGICGSCPKNLNCRTCVHKNLRYQDDWKWPVRGSYYYHIGRGLNHPSFSLQADTVNRNDNIVVCTSCKIGYILYEGVCIKACHSSCQTCIVVNFESQCIECKSTQQGQLQSVDNGECLLCPHNCGVCRKYSQTEAQQINVYFDLSDEKYRAFSSQCLKKFNLPDLYYSWDLTQFTECTVLKKPCYKRAAVSFQMYCSDQMFETARLSAADISQFDKRNLKLSGVFSNGEKPSFPQIETPEFYQIMNQKQVKHMIITLNLLYDSVGTCKFTPFSKVVNKLQNYIFSLQQVELELVGNQNLEFELNTNVSVANFTTIKFKTFQFSLKESSYISLTSLKEQSIYFDKVKFKAPSKTPRQLMFNMKNIAKLQLSKVDLEDLYIENSSAIFNYEFSDSFAQTFDFQISNIKITGSTFVNSRIFQIDLSKPSVVQVVEISQMNVFSSLFRSAAIIQTRSQLGNFMEKIQLKAQNIQFSGIEIDSSTLLGLQTIKSFVEQVSLDNSKFTNALLIEVDLFTLQTWKITRNFLEGSRIISSAFSLNIDFENQIFDFTSQFNTYTTAQAFIGCLTPYQRLSIKNLVLQSNSLKLTQSARLQPILAKIALIYLEAKEIVILNTNIARGQGYPELAIEGAQSVSIETFTIALDQTFVIEPLHYSYECIAASLIEQQYTTFLFLYGIKRITLKKLQVSGLLSINRPLIQIRSMGQMVLNQEEVIEISDSIFNENIMVATVIGVEQSIIAIQSQQVQKITFLLDQFGRNHQHCYFQDINYRSSSTIYVQSPASQVNILETQIYNCLITNNKGSNLLIAAKKLQIRSSRLDVLNQLVFANLQKNLRWGAGDSYYLENLREFLTLDSLGGAGYFNVEELEIEHVQVKLSSAFLGGGFYVELKGEGVVRISHSFFRETEATLKTGSNSQGGALFLNSATASLKLLIHDCQFENTFSRESGGGIHIIPSDFKNDITIANNLIRNSFSLAGAFLYVASATRSDPNSLQVLIINQIVENTDIGQFLSKVIELSDQEVEDFSQCYLIDINRGRIIFKENTISSLQLTGLIKATNFYDLTLFEVSVSEYKILAQPILSFAPQELYSGQIKLEHLSFRRFSKFEYKSADVFSLKALDRQPYYCANVPKPTTLMSFYTPEHQLMQLTNNLQKIFSRYSAVRSILEIKDLSSKWIVDIQSSRFENLQCPFCSNGLLHIQGFDFQRGKKIISMTKLQVIRNQCGSEGCVKIEQTEGSWSNRLLQELKQVYLDEQSLEIQSSEFFLNQARIGAGLHLSNIDALVISTLFNQNSASVAGGAIYFVRSNLNESLLLVQTELTNNHASYGGALYVSDYNLNKPELLSIILYGNNADEFGSNLVQPPYKLSASMDQGGNLFNVTSISTNQSARVDIVQIPKSYETQFLFPSGQALSSYQYFQTSTKNYTKANLSLRIIPLNNQGARMKKLTGTSCQLDSRIVDLSDLNGTTAGPFTKAYTNLHTVDFNETSQDYNFDHLIVKFSPQLRSSKALQLRFQCDSVKIPIFDTNPPYLLQQYATNYSLLLNVQTFYCQQGEYLRVENDISLCEVCDSSLDYYSVQPGEACKAKNQNLMKSVTSARIELKEVVVSLTFQGYWRPFEQNQQIEYCRNLDANCLGGWEPGDKSCFQGHIGALCEQCDLYNTRGEGSFSTSTIYKCSSCSVVDDNVTKLVLISIWTMVSIFLSVNSTLGANLIAALSCKFKKIGMVVNPRAGISGVLIKVFTNYMQIISSLTTFQLELPSALTSSVSSVGSPMEAMSYSLDCFLVGLAESWEIEIIYFRIIWGFIMPVFYILAYFLISGILIATRLIMPNSGIISTAFVYMYIYLQPTLIRGLASLVSFREISGVIWIQGNVSYRYNTSQHQWWLIYFLMPFLVLFVLLIPLYMLIQLHQRRGQLDHFETRQKLGYLYNEYTHRSYFWEIVKIYQKSLIILALTFYEDVIVVKAALIFLIVFLYSILSKATNPYQIPFLNRYDEESSIICELSIIMGIAIYASNLTNNQELIWPLFIFLIAANGIFIAQLLLQLIRSQIEMNQEALDKVRDKINEAFPQLKTIRFLRIHLLENRKRQQARIAQRYQLVKKFLKKTAQQRMAIVRVQEQKHLTIMKREKLFKSKLLDAQSSEIVSPNWKLQEIFENDEEDKIDGPAEQKENDEHGINNTMAIYSDLALKSEPSHRSKNEAMGLYKNAAPQQSSYWSKLGGGQSDEVLERHGLMDDEEHTIPRKSSDGSGSQNLSDNQSNPANQENQDTQVRDEIPESQRTNEMTRGEGREGFADYQGDSENSKQNDDLEAQNLWRKKKKGRNYAYDENVENLFPNLNEENVQLQMNPQFQRVNSLAKSQAGNGENQFEQNLSVSEQSGSPSEQSNQESQGHFEIMSEKQIDNTDNNYEQDQKSDPQIKF